MRVLEVKHDEEASWGLQNFNFTRTGRSVMRNTHTEVWGGKFYNMYHGFTLHINFLYKILNKGNSKTCDVLQGTLLKYLLSFFLYSCLL